MVYVVAGAVDVLVADPLVVAAVTRDTTFDIDNKKRVLSSIFVMSWMRL